MRFKKDNFFLLSKCIKKLSNFHLHNKKYFGFQYLVSVHRSNGQIRIDQNQEVNPKFYLNPFFGSDFKALRVKACLMTAIHQIQQRTPNLQIFAISQQIYKIDINRRYNFIFLKLIFDPFKCVMGFNFSQVTVPGRFLFGHNRKPIAGIG